MEYMQRVRPTKKNHLRNDIISATSLTKEEVVEATENLVRKGLVLRSTLDAPGGFVYWLDDD
jgi:hypothetical protein